jgi:hypothetical protein
MPHAYTEDQLVEQPAIGLFAELGWAVAGPPPNAGVAGEPRDAGLLGRETKGEETVVLAMMLTMVLINEVRTARQCQHNAGIRVEISVIAPVSPRGESDYTSEINGCQISVIMPVSPHDENV